jgi:glycerate kinase
MKIVLAPDSFKGSATSLEISTWIKNGIQSEISQCEFDIVEIGDGGEGSLAAVESSGFTIHHIEVMGPTNKTVQAKFGIRGDTAFIEIAEASGLSQLADNKLEPLRASSFGTGQLIRAALDLGVITIVLALGGSACTDAGAGALQALGARLLDSENCEIPLGGGSLHLCEEIDLSALDQRIAQTSFIVASDVSNPLLGPQGTAYIYSPQKGADSSEVDLLEEGIRHFSSLARQTHINTPGAGAAGGLGYMALTFLNAQIKSGISVILELANFESKVKGADLVITGEGKFDSQSLFGKAPMGILEVADRYQVPVALICGQNRLNSSDENIKRFHSIHSLESIEPNLDSCINNPGPIIEKISASIAKSLTL